MSSSSKRDFDAVLLDLDGTLLDANSEVHPSNLEALRAAQAAGARIMVATGRSRIATRPVLDTLGLTGSAVVFNGAGVYCPHTDQMLEERTLSNRTVARLLELGEELDLLTLVMLANRKLSSVPRNENERQALAGLQLVENVPRDQLRQDCTIRISFLGEHDAGSDDLVRRVEEYVGQPMYLTHFPLSMLPSQRGSIMQVVDAHPPCKGKAEALRVLEESMGIAPERVVAIGDASNDVPMLREAGLGVAMANSMPSALAAADRVIGHHDSDAIAGLISELFLE